MNPTLPMNWGIQVQSLLSDLLLKADDNNDPKNSNRPKVTKIIVPPKPSHNFRPTKIMANDRPKVTKVKVTKKNGDGTDSLSSLYDYEFEIDVEMNGYSGNLTIKLMSDGNPTSLLFEDIPVNQQTLHDKLLKQPALFGITGTGNYEFGVQVTIPSDNDPEGVEYNMMEVYCEYTHTQELTFFQKIKKLFSRLFRNK